MAEIDIRKYELNILHLRQVLFCVLIAFFFPSFIYSQSTDQNAKSKKKIEIIHCDSLGQDQNAGNGYRRLLGNVAIKHNDILMYCDSAHHYASTKRVLAFSKVHIKQGDTLDLFGNYLFYDGVEGKAFVQGNVELIDKETHLYSNTLNYDVNTKIASYMDRGKITNEKNTLTSIIGIYYTSQKMFHFKDSVKIVNPDYVMSADTMDYNTESGTAFFTGPTRVKGDSINIHSEKGWYDTKKDISRIWKNSIIDNGKQIIHGDSIFYDKTSGFGEAFRNVTIEDTINKILVTGNYAWVYKKPESFLITDKAVFIQISNKDSLFLHADTISAATISNSSGSSYRLMKAFHKCRIFSAGLQAKCDSLSYSFQDSVIRMYHAPVIWSEVNQMTSDSIAIFTKNRQTDRMELYNTAFIAGQVDSIRFNQIRGRNLTGFFRDNKMYRMIVEGNSELIYFLVDKEGQVGWNRAKCSRIEIFLDKGKISQIIEFQNPDGIMNPPLKEKERQKLDGFNWYDQLRPKNKLDIF
jgi:lipopolysaccharide export system protein LptA